MKSLKEIKNITFQSSSMGTIVTVGDYLKELLMQLWKAQWDFIPCNPFYKTENDLYDMVDWECDIYGVFVEHGIIHGYIDKDNFDISIEEIKKADKIIIDIILSEM